MNHFAPFLTVFSVCLLAACSSTEMRPPFAQDTGAKLGVDPAGSSSPALKLVDAAIVALKAGDYPRAVGYLNTSVKLEPRNPYLHYMLGFAYHLEFSHGQEASGVLAETGYQTALKFGPNFVPARLQLARLYEDQDDHQRARHAFASAMEIEPTNPLALYGLAVASLQLDDRKTAVAAVEKLDAIQWRDPLLHRLKAVMFASAGRGEHAETELRSYKSSGAEPVDAAFMTGRVRHIMNARYPVESPTVTGPAESRPASALIMAQAGPPAGFPPTINWGAPSSGNPAAPYSGAPSGGNQINSNAPAQSGQAWYSCDNFPNLPQPSLRQRSGGGPQVEDDYIMPALPAPCNGRLPRMAVLEVTLFESAEETSNTAGINLLQGLTAFGNANVTTSNSRTESTNGGTTSASGTITRLLSTGYGIANQFQGTTGLINYSLNIANSAYARSSIVARPNLLVVDKVPSSFFSGSKLTIGLAAGVQGSGAITQQTVGLGLAATPTFIDDDTVLLAVRVTRSSLQQIPSGVSFGQNSFNTDTNAMYGNVVLKFDQSLILSGLSAREKDETSKGTPFLQDIPAIQYLFRNRTSVDVQKQVIVFITMRRAPSDKQDPQSDPKLVELYKRLGLRSSTGQGELVEGLGSVSFFRDFVKGDAMLGKWNRTLVSQIADEARNFIYLTRSID